MEKNRSNGASVRAGGTSYVDAAGQNGFGSNSDAPFSNGQGTYNPQPQSAPPVNADGMENFHDERFSGDKGGQPRPAESASGGNGRDGIERMGDASGSERIGRAF